MRVVESGAFKKTPQSRAEIIGQLIIARVQSALRGQFDFVRRYERPACDCQDYSQRAFHRGRDGRGEPVPVMVAHTYRRLRTQGGR